MNNRVLRVIHFLVYALVLAIGLTAGFIVFDRVLMPAFTRSKGVREIPDVVNLSETDAEVVASSFGFDFRVSRKEYSDSIAENIVISQRPEPGSKAKKGRRISVVVSLSTELVQIPDVSSAHIRQARLELDAFGLFPGENIYENSDSVEKDIVIATSPPIGSEVEIGDSVDIIVSLGSERALVKVPNFMGQKVENAQEIANNVGLGLIIQHRRIPSMQAGTVYRQSPEAGVILERGNAVVVIVAQGEE